MYAQKDSISNDFFRDHQRTRSNNLNKFVCKINHDDIKPRQKMTSLFKVPDIEDDEEAKFDAVLEFIELRFVILFDPLVTLVKVDARKIVFIFN